MDFVRLGGRYTTSYLPDYLIEGYSSLIWTERFEDPGEFEVRTVDVDRVSALLPEDTLVSHLDTQEVMIVETQEIEENANGHAELVVKGRSADSFLENRFVEATYQKKRKMRYPYSATSAAAVLIYNAICNNTGRDLSRGDSNAETPELNDYPYTTLDQIGNVIVTESVQAEGPVRNWLLEEGMLYPQLREILNMQNLGLRTMRPSGGTGGNMVGIKAQLAERGVPVRTAVSNVQSLRFDIYQGVDRRNSVQFSRLQGHFDKAKYLQSNRDFRTVCEVKSEFDGADIYRNGTEAAYTGWRRRTMEYDGGAPEIPPEPEKPEELRKNATKKEKEDRAEEMDKWLTKHAKWKNKKNAIVAEFRAENSQKALGELRKARRTSMFSGDISALAPYQFKTHYNLGDIVTLFGDYGRVQPMIVSEHVRTEDRSGDRGFPGLVAP